MNRRLVKLLSILQGQADHRGDPDAGYLLTEVVADHSFM